MDTLDISIFLIINICLTYQARRTGCLESKRPMQRAHTQAGFILMPLSEKVPKHYLFVFVGLTEICGSPNVKNNINNNNTYHKIITNN